jgi:hypothetical protein
VTTSDQTTPEPEAQPAQQPEGTEPEQQPESRQERRDVHVREQLRTVEAERDQLRERLDARDRASVLATAKASLGEKGAALFSYDLDALRDPETGDLDPAKVEQAIEPVRAALDEGRQSHHGDMGTRQNIPNGRKATWDQLIGGKTPR